MLFEYIFVFNQLERFGGSLSLNENLLRRRHLKRDYIQVYSSKSKIWFVGYFQGLYNILVLINFVI